MFQTLLKVVQKSPETLSEEEKKLLVKEIQKLSDKYGLNLISPKIVHYPNKSYDL